MKTKTLIFLAAAALMIQMTVLTACSERNSITCPVLDAPRSWDKDINSGHGCRKIIDSLKYELCMYKFLNNERKLIIRSYQEWFDRNEITPDNIYIGHPFNPDNCK